MEKSNSWLLRLGGIPGPNEDFVILDVSEKLAGGKKGPSDLWISYLNERTWTKPVPMGAGVNKPESWDNFPFFSPTTNNKSSVVTRQLIIQ